MQQILVLTELSPHPKDGASSSHLPLVSSFSLDTLSLSLVGACLSSPLYPEVLLFWGGN